MQEKYIEIHIFFQTTFIFKPFTGIFLRLSSYKMFMQWLPWKILVAMAMKNNHFLSKSTAMILHKCFFNDPKIILIRWKTWPTGPVFLICIKSFCQKSTSQILKWFGTNVPLVTLYQDCSKYTFQLKHMATMGCGFFSFQV